MLALALCLQLQAELVEKDGTWSFRIQGASSGARARVFALWEVGGALDEEALGPGDTIDEDGHLYSFKRKPYSLTYRVRVGGGFVDIPGDPEKLKAEIRERGEELARDLEEIRTLFDELRAQFPKGLHKTWLDPWMDRVQEVQARNEDRFEIWAVYIEKQAKIRVNGFCQRLPELASASGDPKLAQRMMVDFLGYLEEAEIVLGIDLPLEARVLGPVLQRHLDAKDRKTAIAALQEIVDQLPRHRKAYRLVAQILEAYLKGDAQTHAVLVTEFKALLK